MTGILHAHIGCEVQIATVLDLIVGILVSVDDTKLTLRTSGLSGYEYGSHLILQISEISFIRFSRFP